MERELETVKDLIEYLQTLPQDAAPFTYSSQGGFLSLDTGYFKYLPEDNMLYLDYSRFEDENEKRQNEGKEWLDITLAQQYGTVQYYDKLFRQHGRNKITLILTAKLADFAIVENARNGDDIDEDKVLEWTMNMKSAYEKSEAELDAIEYGLNNSLNRRDG